MLNEKFILDSKAVIGNVLAIAVVLGSMGYVSFTQAQADQFLVLLTIGGTLATNVFSIYGRLKAKDKLYFLKKNTPEK